MMMRNNSVQAYQNNSISTATPEELTLMLYNGAIKFLKQAKAAIEERNIVKAHENNIKVQNIIHELIVTLDRSYPIADQFLAIYDYLLHRTIEANVKKDISIHEEVENFFIQFRDTWKEAMVIAKKNKSGLDKHDSTTFV
jgi:flagellar secretion chaperone FliS